MKGENEDCVVVNVAVSWSPMHTRIDNCIICTVQDSSLYTEPVKAIARD